jgi:hypothetical protein
MYSVGRVGVKKHWVIERERERERGGGVLLLLFFIRLSGDLLFLFSSGCFPSLSEKPDNLFLKGVQA